MPAAHRFRATGYLRRRRAAQLRVTPCLSTAGYLAAQPDTAEVTGACWGPDWPPRSPNWLANCPRTTNPAAGGRPRVKSGYYRLEDPTD